MLEDVNVLERDEIDVEVPKDYAVIYLNDNYSSWGLVKSTLMEICHKTEVEAEAITRDVHEKGKGIGYIGTEDICLTKRLQIMHIARLEGMPLKIEVAAN